jgi:uncharacterized protein
MPGSSCLRSLGGEVSAVAERFEKALAELGLRGQRRCPDPGIVPWNIVVLLPFALVDALNVPGGADVARRMALANAFGAAHFLVQDAVLDGEREPSPQSCHMSDACLLRFAGLYTGLLRDPGPLSRHLERYLREYFGALSWERDVLGGDVGDAVAHRATLRSAVDALDGAPEHLGRRMAPLKVTAAATALLAGRQESLPGLERMIDDFHCAYQLSDDLDDLTDDLKAGRWSLAAWVIAARSGLGPPRDWPDGEGMLLSGARSGALDELIGDIVLRYRKAARRASAVGSPALRGYFEQHASRAERVYSRRVRRMRASLACGTSALPAPVSSTAPRGVPAYAPSAASGHAPPTAGPRTPRPSPARARSATTHAHSQPPHVFRAIDRDLVYDPGSGLFFEADGLAVEALKWLRDGRPEPLLAVLRMNHGDAVDEVLEEISAAGLGRCPAVSPAPDCEVGASLSGLATLALNVSGDCNLRCDYCYLDPPVVRASLTMSERTARAAFDLLMRESFGEPDLALVFFGGEPLLAPGVVEAAGRYAVRRAEKEGRRLSLHMTTNGVLLTQDVTPMLEELGVRVMISIDGGREVHDAHRRTAGGDGSYDAIVENLSRLPAGMPVSARATITDGSPPLPELVAHLRELGFEVVHLAPVSGRPLEAALVDRLLCELDELARVELKAVLAGARPSAGNFIEPVLALELGRQRLVPCGAGVRYVSVGHDGRLYLCHRFAGDGPYDVGDVDGGLDRGAVGRLLDALSRRAGSCAGCWAWELCGGPCHHDVACASGDAAGPRSQRCRIIRRTFELSMWLYSSLPEEHRNRLRRAAERSAAGRRACEIVNTPALRKGVMK